MPTLDTNIWVRYLVNDDPQQHAMAVHCIESLENAEPVFIPLTVALELEWVLRSRYDVDKATIIKTFTQLLETVAVEFESESSMERALSLFDEYTADFADCLHLALAITHEHAPMITLDLKAARLPGAELLSAYPVPNNS